MLTLVTNYVICSGWREKLASRCLLLRKQKKINWSAYFMATNGFNAQASTTTRTQHRFGWLLSGIALRLLIAFIISWLIILAFFATGVVSH
jgi:hypothetical protein